MQIKLSFDDATVEDLIIADLLRRYHLHSNTVFYWPVKPKLANEIKGRKSLNNHQMDSIAEDFEIGSHTISHKLLTRISQFEAQDEISKSRKMLKMRFKQSIYKFCYPRGYANYEIMETVKLSGYKSARGVDVGYISKSENPYYEQTTVHVGCDRKEYGGKNWYDYAIYMLGIAKREPNSVYHIWGHSWELAKYPQGFKLFEKLLDKVCDV